MMQEQADIRIYAGTASMNFAKRMCDELGVELGKSQAFKFSEGNTFVKIHERVRDKDVYIVQTIGLDPNNEFMELLFYIDAFKRSSAASITAVIPFFSYAKGDKKDEPRVSIRARVCADCLEAAGVDVVLTMDLHSPQIQGFFKKPVDHLYGMNILTDHIKGMGLQDLVVVSPDAGFAKNARKYAARLGTPLAIGDKVRIAHDENAQVMELIGDVWGKTALIVDDFTISAGTLIDMARALKEHGALDVYACVSHALLQENGLEKLMDSPIKKLITTDTVENPQAFSHPKIITVSAAPLFAKAVDILHTRESLSQLF